MFDITFQDPNDPTGKAKESAYQNSWGITQRTLGVMIMVHGDDKGLVLAPSCAGVQVVIIPVGLKASSTQEERDELAKATENALEKLQEAGVRAKLDERDYSPGWKFNYWEMKGVPLRIELGPMDLKKGEFVMSKRNVPDPKAGKIAGKLDTLVLDVKKTLADVHTEMYNKALADRDGRLAFVDDWKDFSPNLNQGKMCLIPFCGVPECEEMIKEKSKEEAQDSEVAGGLKMGAKSLCIPHEDKYNLNCPQRCIIPECAAKYTPLISPIRRVLFGRSY
jgi:prolyl-tRNA synthetase